MNRTTVVWALSCASSLAIIAIAGACSNSTGSGDGDDAGNDGSDAAASCGVAGTACCLGARCIGALLCTGGMCLTPSEAGANLCGGAGQACCAGSGCGGGLTCKSGTCMGAMATNGTGQACSHDADCPSGDACISVGARSVCTTSCGSNADCVKGWMCGPAGISKFLCQCTTNNETCNGADDDCNGVIDDEPVADIECGSGKSCLSGACTCTGAMCNGVCTRLQSDPQNCGTCNVTCPTTCTNARCDCPVGTTFCQNKCSDFTSDADNCGLCFAKCPTTSGTAQCIASKCHEIVSIGQTSANHALTIDGTYAYWISNASVFRAPLDASAPAIVLTSGLAVPTYLAASGSFIYVTTQNGLVKLDASATSTATLVANLSGRGGPVVVDGTTAYFASSNKLYSVALTATNAIPTTLATLATDATAIALDASAVYVADGADTLYAVPLVTGGARSIAIAAIANGIFVDPGTLYYTSSDGHVFSTPTALTSAGAVFASGLAFPYGLTGDATNLYAATAGGISSIKKSDGTVVSLALASGTTSPAQNATYVYFMTSAGPSRVNK